MAGDNGQTDSAEPKCKTSVADMRMGWKGLGEWQVAMATETAVDIIYLFTEGVGCCDSDLLLPPTDSWTYTVRACRYSSPFPHPLRSSPSFFG